MSALYRCKLVSKGLRDFRLQFRCILATLAQSISHEGEYMLGSMRGTEFLKQLSSMLDLVLNVIEIHIAVLIVE